MKYSWKIGDTLQVIDAGGYDPLKRPTVVIADSPVNTNDGFELCKVNTSATAVYYANRFMKLPVTPSPSATSTPTTIKTMCRDIKGRFAKSNATPANNVALNLRRGSLYRILGGSIARLRDLTFDNNAVVSVHNKPLIVKRDRLRLADKEDVAAYLEDGKALKSKDV